MILSWSQLSIFVVGFLCVIVEAIPDYLLKTCSQSGFCQRNRHYADNIPNNTVSPYELDTTSIQFTNNTFKATVIKTIPRPDRNDIQILLPFTLYFLPLQDSVRFIMDEIRPSIAGTDLLMGHRYNETWKYVTNGNILITKPPKTSYKKSRRQIVLSHGNIKLEVGTSGKFQIKVFYKKKLAIIVNERSFLNVEHYRLKDENFQHLLPWESSFNMFADNFEYSKSDTLPMGPESVSLDFTLLNIPILYGIPEHADSLALRDTHDGNPYRLFNVDVFEYNINSTNPTYGSIPLMIGSNKNGMAIGVYWNNPSDTWVDISYAKKGSSMVHWISESAVIDVVLFLGDTPADITKSFIQMSGGPALPLMSAIGYHQCRWNYNDELDVLMVDSEMDRLQIPYDFIWLDLEYTDDKKYFTWKPNSFPNPSRLLSKLGSLGRQLAILLDPHLKENYHVSDEVLAKNVAVKDHKGDSFFGHCWPGQSIWIDTFGKYGSELWSSFFQKFYDYSTNMLQQTNLHIWNDMNEPSIFDGPETTAPKDLIHDGQFEERSVHNLYGLTVHESTYNSLRELYAESRKRPFVLTRSFFSGSQRTAATWTGDNAAKWEYLQISIPMVLSNNIVGMPFIGADVPGFSGNPENELTIRWYQAGLWYPFFRGHAHIDTKRREPYLFEEPIRTMVRDAIQLRYSLLPTFYTAFYKANIKGTPVLSPMFFKKPQYPELYEVDDQFYLGDHGILVKPITSAGQRTVDVILPPGIYYDYNTLSVVSNNKKLVTKTFDAPLDSIPIFIEGGHIFTKRCKYRRSSKLMKQDPYTIIVAPDNNGNAQGELYVDDGETYAYEDGEYLHVKFELSKNRHLKGSVLHLPPGDKINDLGSMNISKIIMPSSKLAGIGSTANVVQDGKSFVSKIEVGADGNAITIANPMIDITKEWEVYL